MDDDDDDENRPLQGLDDPMDEDDDIYNLADPVSPSGDLSQAMLVPLPIPLVSIRSINVRRWPLRSIRHPSDPDDDDGDEGDDDGDEYDEPQEHEYEDGHEHDHEHDDEHDHEQQRQQEAGVDLLMSGDFGPVGNKIRSRRNMFNAAQFLSDHTRPRRPTYREDLASVSLNSFSFGRCLWL
jgi:hypothetical protein